MAKKIMIGCGVFAAVVLIICFVYNAFLGYQIKELDARCPMDTPDGFSRLVKVDYDSYLHATYYFESTNIFISVLAEAILNSDKEALLDVKKNICTNEYLQDYALDVTYVYTDQATSREFFRVSVDSEECE